MELEAAMDQEIARYRSVAYQDSTKKVYRTHRDAYLRFCIFCGYRPVPVDKDVLARYVVFLARSLKYSSVTQYLNIVKLLHLEAGFPNPLADNWFVQTIVMGIKRDLGNKVEQKQPISPEVLLRLFEGLDLSTSQDACFWAAALMAFFCFFRKSNLLPKSERAYDPNIHLRVEDVQFFKWGAMIQVRWSKTIQYRQRIIQVPMPLLVSHPLCPVSALLHSWAINGNRLGTNPLFMFSQQGRLKTLTHSMFVNKLKILLSRAGMDPSLYSGHSFRRGGASFAFEAGVSPDLINMQGDWRSEAYQRYIVIPHTTKISAISKMASYLKHTKV